MEPSNSLRLKERVDAPASNVGLVGMAVIRDLCASLSSGRSSCPASLVIVRNETMIFASSN